MRLAVISVSDDRRKAGGSEAGGTEVGGTEVGRTEAGGTEVHANHHKRVRVSVTDLATRRGDKTEVRPEQCGGKAR